MGFALLPGYNVGWEQKIAALIAAHIQGDSMPAGYQNRAPPPGQMSRDSSTRWQAVLVW